MESCKKLVLLVVTVALVLQAMVPPPTAFATRNDVMSIVAGEAKNPGNYLAMVLDVNRPRNCIPKGGWCMFDIMGCCKPCGCLAGFCWVVGEDCN
ncbi:uncharacterized protein LOC120191909 [Hibiscus syriacus]|uniref:uncharacterized protein LOC120191909 n=1 Tax=Hibiscus syriacus TaxID=106335 RepID=UPI001924BD98|nr:uncharacterized protein LOC120191909 [Hibiscus syriacus]